MCLIYNKADTDAIRKAMADGTATFFKLYTVTTSGQLVPPVQGGIFDLPADGVIVSNRAGADASTIELSNGIERGIHVYTDKDDASDSRDNGSAVFPVIVDPADFVAAGHDHAVFTKIRIDLEAAKKIIADAVANPYVDDWDDDDDYDDDEDDWDDDRDEENSYDDDEEEDDDDDEDFEDDDL